MKQSVPRLKDIAKEANVSMTTASLILRNEKGRFHSDTRHRVINVARKLGWRRNLLVESLQTGKTRTVGVLVPPYDSFWSNVLFGLHHELVAADYMPITLWIGDDIEALLAHSPQPANGLDQINRLIDRRVEGFVLWPDTADAYSDLFKELVERGVPVVVIDSELTDEKIADSIQTDEESGSYQVAQHLLKLGHRNIGCLIETELASKRWQVARQRYFEFALSECHAVQYRSWALEASDPDGKRVASLILDDPNRPTAIFCDTDHLAHDLYHVAHEKNIRIPEDISVVGFSDLDFAKTMRPPLTTVRQKPLELGRHAARLLIGRITGELKDAEPHTIKVGCSLIERESTALANGK
ncbi:MAG: LacI family DNA-binding transcriptional regulator [Sedimentisphaerales bacterium]|nr:LacI family DNA-binding transcriptional regulator [Sedimentisphaerales bacterium]